MKAVKEICIAGKTIEVIVKVTSGNHRNKRKQKQNITVEKVQKNNDRLAVIHLRRVLNANFKEGDLHVVLTYSSAPEVARAKKDRENFVEKMKRRMKKQGKELKYVAVTEFAHARIHHHFVINCNDLEMIQQAWGKGLLKSTPLDDSGNYTKLAEYLLKETQKTFREDSNPNKKRWSGSANLIRPKTKRMPVDIGELFAEPKAISGYYIPKDYNRRYEHPVTGLEHLEYIMVALDEPRRYKTWPRGKLVSGKEYFRVEYEEEQTSLLEQAVFGI